VNLISIDTAARIYEITAKCEIIRHHTNDTKLYYISHALHALNSALGSEAKEEYWRQTLGPIRRFVFTLCSTPLPFDLVATASGIEWDILYRQTRLCQQLYPGSHDSLLGLVQKLECLTGDSPFIAPLELICRENCRISVIIHNSRMNQTVAEYFTKNTRLQNAKVASVRQLKETGICDVLVTIGPCSLLHDYIFLAPRTHRIHVLTLNWIHELWKPSSVFLSDSQSIKNKSSSHCIGKLPQITDQYSKSESVLPSQGLPNLQPLDLLPPVLSFRKEMLHKAGWYPNPNEETTHAKFCKLSGDRAVFVSADEKASQLVIDLSETSRPAVKRLPASALEPDIYLLLRTAGGGDFIAPLADRILGSIAKERRTQQAEWKRQLIFAAQKQFGALSRRELSTHVSSYLCTHGFSKARPANIHYWMSSKCIHPHKEEDFIAVLNFAGIADKARELWEAMEDIEQAHRSAGHTIRKMLLQRIATVSLEPLKRDGMMSFDLGEQDGGILSAFQITHISEEEFDISVNLIGVLLDYEE
jgi:hypothetical protein